MSSRKGWHLIFYMEERICSFFGHRNVDITDLLYEKITAEIMRVIKCGCHIFYFGGYGAFDSLCHEVVTKIREEKPEFKIERVYCVAQERYLRKKVRYFNPNDYEKLIYLEPSFSRFST